MLDLDRPRCFPPQALLHILPGMCTDDTATLWSPYLWRTWTTEGPILCKILLTGNFYQYIPIAYNELARDEKKKNIFLRARARTHFRQTFVMPQLAQRGSHVSLRTPHNLLVFCLPPNIWKVHNKSFSFNRKQFLLDVVNKGLINMLF